LEEDGLRATHHLRLDNAGTVPKHLDFVGVILEKSTVGRPGLLQRLLAGIPGSLCQLVEGGAAGDIAFASSDPVTG
jgi:hypothetical protein